MKNKYQKASVTMAIALGIFLPALETVRRIHQVLAFTAFTHWFDDYSLGIVLLLAAYLVIKQKNNSREFLIAAWGMAVGGLFLSWFGQLGDYFENIADPGIFSSGLVLVAKTVIFAYTITGLYLSIKSDNAGGEGDYPDIE